MSFKVADFVQETSNSTGTGDFVLAGAAGGGYETFSANFSDGDTLPYCITDGVSREVGIGTYHSGANSLTRTTVLASTNGNALVSFGGGAKTVFVGLPADGFPTTTGSVPFVGSNGLLTQDNANLFWDGTNKRLGIGTVTPTGNSLHIYTTAVATHTDILGLNQLAGVAIDISTSTGTPSGPMQAINAEFLSKYNPGGSISGNFNVFRMTAQIDSSVSTNYTGNFTALNGQCIHNGTGTASELAGLAVTCKSTNSGNVTVINGLLVNSPVRTSSGTIASAYGLYISPQLVTGVTIGYGIYQSSASDLNYFAGPLVLAPQSAPSATQGAIWNDTTQQSLAMFNGSSTPNAVKTMVPGVLGVTTTSVSSTTTAETKSLVGTITGTFTCPANFMVVGKKLRLHARGVMTTGATSGTVTFQVLFAGTVIASTGGQAVTTGQSNNYWELEADIVCRTTGGSGTFFVQGKFSKMNAATPAAMVTWPVRGNSADPPAAVVVDTTASSLIDLQSITSNALHTVTCNLCSLEVLN